MPVPYKDVDFPSEYPRQDVADHEVLMSFTGDSDAILFRDWWHEEGSAVFSEWLRGQKG